MAIETYLNKVTCIDCLELMDALPPQSISAIITDIPYGTTACSWDTIIPFEPMWQGVKRVLKPRGVFVTTASQPFTSALVMSNPKWFKYEWVWEKNNGTGGMNANKMPIKKHENVLVFYDMLPSFYPQFTKGTPYRIKRNKPKLSSVYGKTGVRNDFISINLGIRYPDTVIYFDTDTGLHPTQKPVALYEYLIRTYTREGDTVLDFCAGSGTTGLAARNCGRQYILGDTDAGYCAIAEDRLRLPFTPRAVTPANDVSDLPLFAALDTR